MPWPSVDSKTQLRLNVLRHRQTLLKLLENTNDTTLKPRIKFDPTDFDKLLGKPIKKEPITDDIKIKTEPISNDVKIKKEPIDEPYDSADDISVGSSEGWSNTQVETPVETPVENKISYRTRSKSFTSIPYNYENPVNTLKEDHMYASDPVEERETYIDRQKKSVKRLKRRRSPLPVGQRTRSRPRESFDRIKHNAKERACREEIAKMFGVLRECCISLDSNRRVPSKQSILICAKKECDELIYSEKNLIAEKKKLRSVNVALEKKLKRMRSQRKR